MTKPTIILVSQSPRRRDLLKQIGLSFRQMPADIDEEAAISGLQGKSPALIVKHLAKLKALAAKTLTAQKCLILSADTIVVLDGKILGKPKNEEDAAAMLRMLSGRTHQVYTGVTLLDTATGKSSTKCCKTDVTFAKLTEHNIADYIKTGEPADKAGSYGAQGKAAAYIKSIKGCYFNVVGLPLSLLRDMLVSFGVYI